jgi:S1-C subfamily serine protease
VVACDEPSVLRVDAQVSEGEVQGSAFVVRSDSTGTYLLTNRHVIEGATPDQTRLIAPDGRITYPVLAILANKAKSGTAGDLAVIKIRPTSLHPLPFAHMADVAAGEPVASIGYGMAFQLAGAPSVTEGIVSAVGRDLGDGFGPVWIQHQSTINAGNSGGPLLAMDGHVVGVNTLSMDQLASGQSVHDMFFAIPANLAQSTAARLIAQLQNPTATLLRATQSRASRVGTAFYTLPLPAGWISSRLSRSQPVLFSRDQLVQVQLGTSATRNRLSTAGLHQMISRLVAVVDGVYVMLAPLSKGQHTIHFHGEAPLSPTATFILDVTYQLRVT